jgi:ribose 5-phosphate isomerase B
VIDGICECGILICGTGIGMSIAANKIKGIRAALCRDYLSAQRARNHNNANVLCLGAEYISDELNEIVHVFLNDGFEGGRHQRRLDKVTDLESQV